MKKSHLRWIEGELPRLIEAEILSPDDADRVGEYYRSMRGTSMSSLLVLICSVFGAGLIGSGIILLLAHNWEDFSRLARTVIAFTPLVVAQALVGWTLYRNNDSVAWREGSGTFLTMAIGTTIALIGQTYHIPGNLESFLFIWLLLGLPALYLLRSTVIAIFYLVGLCAWVMVSQGQGGHALLYSPLLFAVLPFLWHTWRHHREKLRTQWLARFLCLNLIISLGFVLEHVIPGVWIVSYTSLFSIFYLIGRTKYRDAPAQLFTNIGVVGTIIMALAFTFGDVWRNIGYHHYRSGYQYHEWAAAQDYILTLVLLTLCIAWGLRHIRQGNHSEIIWLVSPIMAFIFFALMNIINEPALSLIAVAAYNLYLFALGILTLRTGVREGQLGTANSGVCILALLFIVRFFDSNLDFVSRGILFILIGIIFLATNLVTARKGRTHSGDVS